MNLKVRFLSDEEIKLRYPIGNQSGESEATRNAIARGYKIVLVESEFIRLHPRNIRSIYWRIQWPLNQLISQKYRDFHGFTDLSETTLGKVYCAIKEE